MIIQGIFKGEYKVAVPNTSASFKHDSVSLYFYEKPSDELIKKLSDIANKYNRGHRLLAKKVVNGFSLSEIGNIESLDVENLFKLLMIIDPEASIQLSGVFYSKRIKRYGLSEGQYYALKQVFSELGLNLTYARDKGFSLFKNNEKIGVDMFERFGVQPIVESSFIVFRKEVTILEGQEVPLSLTKKFIQNLNLNGKYEIYVRKEEYGNHLITVLKDGKLLKRFVDDGADHDFQEFSIKSRQEGLSIYVNPGQKNVVLQERVFIDIPNKNEKQTIMINDQVKFNFWKTTDKKLIFQQLGGFLNMLDLNQNKDYVLGSLNFRVFYDDSGRVSLQNLTEKAIKLDLVTADRAMNAESYLEVDEENVGFVVRNLQESIFSNKSVNKDEAMTTTRTMKDVKAIMEPGITKILSSEDIDSIVWTLS